jgi:peptidoglycan/LPS O-acetylase OafA/YrhL
VPVQPTSAEIGETAVEVQATTEADAKTTAAATSDSATECQAGGPGEVVPADADAVEASEADAGAGNGNGHTSASDAAAGPAKAAKPQGKEPPTNEFPAIRLIGSWGRVSGEADAGGSSYPRWNGTTNGQATSNVRLTTAVTAAPPASAASGKGAVAEQPAKGEQPANAEKPEAGKAGPEEPAAAEKPEAGKAAARSSSAKAGAMSRADKPAAADKPGSGRAAADKAAADKAAADKAAADKAAADKAAADKAAADKVAAHKPAPVKPAAGKPADGQSADAGLTVTIKPAAASGQAAASQATPPAATPSPANAAQSAASQPAAAPRPFRALAPSAVPRQSDPARLTVTIEPAATTDAASASKTVVQAEPATADKAATSDQAAAPGQPVAAADPAPATGQAGWRAPGLDGVRALAVLAVLAFHEGLPWIHGGFLGVDVFFVLSGYLITDLLVARYRKDGHIGLGRFYQRRARRLLSALALMLLTVTAAVSLLEPGQRSAMRPALLGAVTYTSNWWQALAHQSYFSLYGPPPVFQHLWSLAVEEQFYLIWPLLLAVILTLVHRQVTRALLAWGGAVAAALLMLGMYTPGADPSLVYYGTDTHASALMIGAALAITWPLAKIAATTGRARQVLDVLGAAGLVILAWSAWHLSGPDPFVYPYGLVLAAVAAGGLILAAAAPGRIGRLLSWRPLRWLGVRSYGIYLWHWPVIAITTGMAPRSATSAPIRLIDTALPIVLAAASWHWLESPILRNGLLAELGRWGSLLRLGPRGFLATPSAAVPGLTAVVLLAVACTAGYGLVNAQQANTLQAQISSGLRVSSSTLPPQPSGEANPWWLIPGRMPFHRIVHTKAPKPKPVHVPGARVMAIGDSVMLASAPELAASMPGIYINAKVSRAMIAGISIVDQLARDKRLRRVVIVGLGTNGPITSSQIRQLRGAVGDRWLVLINTFVPRSWEHEVNTTLARAARRYPNVLLVNWHNAIEHHQGLLWGDDIHPQPVGGKLYAKAVRKVVLHALHKRPGLSVPHRPTKPVHLSGFLLHASYATLY